MKVHKELKGQVELLIRSLIFLNSSFYWTFQRLSTWQTQPPLHKTKHPLNRPSTSKTNTKKKIDKWDQQINKCPHTCTLTHTYITSTSPHTPQERVVYSKNPSGGHCLPLYSPKTYPKGSPLPSCHHSVYQAYIHKMQLQTLHRPILSCVITLLPSSVLKWLDTLLLYQPILQRCCIWIYWVTGICPLVSRALDLRRFLPRASYLK